MTLIKFEKRLIYTYDDGYTALIKVWEVVGHWGKKYTIQTIHPRK
jgi:hypothetical protein